MGQRHDGKLSMNGRDKFFDSLRRALGRTPRDGPVDVPEPTALSRDAGSLETRVQSVLREADARSDELMSELARSAAQIGWAVTRVDSLESAARRVLGVVRRIEARSLVRSAHAVLDRMELDAALAGTGVDRTLMSTDASSDEALEAQRGLLRERAIAADVGVTGVDYAIAETGSCVLLATRGVSRLVSLLPPVHVAVVEKGQVLPSLDELFLLRHHAFLQGNGESYMNIISGPSRSADIEQTLVKGVHGPGEAHMVLVG